MSLQAYAADLCPYPHRGYPTFSDDQLEELMWQDFVCGLPPEWLREQIHLSFPGSLVVALGKAKRMECLISSPEPHETSHAEWGQGGDRSGPPSSSKVPAASKAGPQQAVSQPEKCSPLRSPGLPHLRTPDWESPGWWSPELLCGLPQWPPRARRSLLLLPSSTSFDCHIQLFSLFACFFCVVYY